MQEKRSFYYLLIIMSAVALIVMAITNVILYQVAFEQRSKSLVEMAQSQARLIEAMARYNRRTNRVDWETPVGERGPTSLLSERAAADTISQLKDAHKNYEGIGRTGEFVIAGIENESIVFLLIHRHGEQTDSEPVPLYSENAEPMRRALFAQSGVMVGTDYRGKQVLAAYEPVDVLNFGIVAKIDMDEVRAPFIGGVVVTWLISVIVIFLGGLLFRRISNPIVQKIVDSEKQYRSLVEEINEWVWMTDEDGIVKYSSPIISDILGRSRESILDTPITSLIEQKSRALAEKALTSKGRKLAFTDMQAMLLNADNELVPMEFSAIPVFNEQFQFKGYRGVARNISDRIEAEQIRQNYQLTLERQVEERTQDLNDINEELKNFTYIVSHDLRSPLVSIVGFSSEIRDDIALLQHKDSDFDSEVKQIVDNNIPESLAFIDKAAEKMERLINSILALSRIGRRDLVFEKVDTQSVVENNLKAIAFQLENINVTVHELPVITSDLSAIEQIFGNLIGNAAKYLEPTRKGEIEIWAEQIQHGWEFYVKDNGKGIATNDIPHVFDLFKRVGNHDVQGEGMGLTYVQSLIRRLNGRIECQSVLGEETTFRFSLPIDE
jgi:PAS domain S-box-containing protein